MLLTENDRGVAYFFTTKEAADATLGQLKGASPEADWDVTPLSLGALWFDLLNKSESESKTRVKSKSFENDEVVEEADESVEYRLVPDYRDVSGAREILSQDAMRNVGVDGENAPSQRFANPYNEVPIFMDLQMRVQDEEGVERFPMYLGLGDMVRTVREFTESLDPSQRAGYDASIDVADLRNIVDQMMQGESMVDFRRALLIPPVPERKPIEVPDISPINTNWVD